jgi:hypothetical protein
MEEEDHEFAYATMPIDLSKLASDQRKMMDLNIRHMKRLMAPLKVNIKGDVQKRINALADELNPNDPTKSPSDKKKVLELSIKDKIKEITKISSSHDFGKHHFIRRSKKLEDPSKPVMRLDVLAMSKNYLEQNGYQDDGLDFDLIRRQQVRKATIIESNKKKKEEKRARKLPGRLTSIEYGLNKEEFKTPHGMTSPRENFMQDLQNFKLSIQNLRKDVNSMILQVSPRKKWLREPQKPTVSPREPTSARNQQMGQTGTLLLHPLDPLRASSTLSNKIKMAQSHTSGLSDMKKPLSTLAQSTSQMSSNRLLAPLVHPSMGKTHMSGTESGFMLSPKSPAIQEGLKEYSVQQHFTGSRTSVNKNERSVSMSKIELNNRSRSRDKSLSKEFLEMNPEVEELFKGFQTTLKKGLKKKKNLNTIVDLNENEMNESIKQAITHYYSPEKPDTKKEVSKRADSIVEK